MKQEIDSAAGTGPGRLFLGVALGRAQTGQFCVTDVVEAAVKVADPAEGVRDIAR
ncbi:hypothetical protein ACIRP7_19570 [Streptomyces sp. NPDC102270]|uniref:hypothetical protein n=1 Tax=Streptomyces sp. NPDC102270 TaxID=3366150 RepID=UPI0037FFFC9A